MDSTQAKDTLDKIIKQVFGRNNPLSLDQFREKFAFDVRLPQQVKDSSDGSTTWTGSTNPTKFIKLSTAQNKEWLQPRQPVNGIQDILELWKKVNIRRTERQLDSTNFGESDGVIESTNVFRSLDIMQSKNILFSDGMSGCEFLAACQRCGDSSFCIRLEDSGECANSFGISWSSKVTNSILMHDCYDMHDSMFCTGLGGMRYCIANMQFEKEEYEELREKVVDWILTPNV